MFLYWWCVTILYLVLSCLLYIIYVIARPGKHLHTVDSTTRFWQESSPSWKTLEHHSQACKWRSIPVHIGSSRTDLCRLSVIMLSRLMINLKRHRMAITVGDRPVLNISTIYSSACNEVLQVELAQVGTQRCRISPKARSWSDEQLAVSSFTLCWDFLYPSQVGASACTQYCTDLVMPSLMLVLRMALVGLLLLLYNLLGLDST